MTLATENRFRQLVTRLGLPVSLAGAEWQSLVARYAESHRHYHNLHHIDSMLEHMDPASPSDPSLELAVWYHDVVYDPRSNSNEAESTRFFSNGPGMYVDPEIHDRVIRLILATDYSRPRSGEADEDLMRDLDLFILAASPDDYLRYCGAIRMEYAHVPDDAFIAGRKAVMARFLESPIFHSPEFVSHEAAARANLLEEIAGLGG